tara:strand:- start:42 stop:281 length:240 start_codon:yes stop_codon:yes gene_type:complete
MKAKTNPVHPIALAHYYKVLDNTVSAVLDSTAILQALKKAGHESYSKPLAIAEKRLAYDMQRLQQAYDYRDQWQTNQEE